MADGAALIQTTYQVSATVWPFKAITTILFGMRAFSRLRLLKDAAGWDDLVLFVSWVRSLDNKSPVRH